jgi:hypothetical protein
VVSRYASFMANTESPKSSKSTLSSKLPDVLVAFFLLVVSMVSGAYGTSLITSPHPLDAIAFALLSVIALGGAVYGASKF